MLTLRKDEAEDIRLSVRNLSYGTSARRAMADAREAALFHHAREGYDPCHHRLALRSEHRARCLEAILAGEPVRYAGADCYDHACGLMILAGVDYRTVRTWLDREWEG